MTALYLCTYLKRRSKRCFTLRRSIAAASRINAAPEATAAPEAAVPEVTPDAGPAFPCQGLNGKCPYVTRTEDDPFCRACDFNDNGVEDAAE